MKERAEAPWSSSSYPEWARTGGYERCPNVLLLDPDLSCQAVRVYMFLQHAAFLAERSEPPSIEEGRTQIGLTERAWHKAVKELESRLLVTKKRRGRGLPNLYVVHPPEPADVQDQEPAKTQVQEPAKRQVLSIASKDSEKQDLEIHAERSLTVVEDAAPKLTKVDGQNLGFNALCEVCGVNPKGNQAGRVAAALNGSRAIKSGIRDLVWRELVEGLGDGEVLHADVNGETFERHLAARIKEQAVMYAKAMPRAQLTPTSLATWWTDLKVQPTRYSAADHLRQLRERNQ